VLQGLNQQGLTILLAEQNMRLSLKFSNRGYVLLHGRMSIFGNSQQLLQDERAYNAYLGKAD